MNRQPPQDDTPGDGRQPGHGGGQPTKPVSPPIVLTSVWQCESPDQADALLGGEATGYVYRRDAHPNADRLSQVCGARHGALWCAITSSGMSALAAVLLSELQAGDHVLLADELYGKTRQLFESEGSRWGLAVDLVDPGRLDRLDEKRRQTTRLFVVETISNPMLRVANVARLSQWCRDRGIRLVVDHTFGSPIDYSPLDEGADVVVESLTKFANGHSDVVLGMVAGRDAVSDRYAEVIRAWGFVSSPFDCWLALRGMATLDVRAERACSNALEVARWLESQASVTKVRYPGLESHPDHALAAKMFRARFGTMITCDLCGGLDAVRRFVREVPFCPSLGEIETTVSHPRTTSHRSWSEEECAAAGILPGTIRLSIGCEPLPSILDMLQRGLDSPHAS